MKSEFDILIVGAGPVGAICARKLADSNLKVRVLDQRSHVAGNCYDEKDRQGILIHKYGPHYFRTNDHELLKYLSRFSDWMEAEYIVKSKYGEKLYPFPINLDTLELFFEKKFTAVSAEAFLESLRLKYAASPNNSEEFVLSRVGEALYRAFYLNYTLKQWDKHPRDLAASVCGRIPIRMNRDNRYVDHKYQVMPKNGFTAMFSNMLAHPNIQLELNKNYFSKRSTPDHSMPALDFAADKYKATLYTGPIDKYFSNRFGELPWRSLNFEFRYYASEFHQPCVQINYPGVDTPYTRSVEFKHVTRQKCPTTTVSYETPTAVGDPYYPIPSDQSQKIYKKYRELADLESQNHAVYFFGRLAEYTYINTDEAIERGFLAAKKILERVKSGS